MLVTLDPEERRSYLDLVFGWYFDRSRAFVIGALAGSVAAIGVVLSNDNFGAGSVIAVGVISVLSAAALLVNHLLSRLHREHLCCLVLLEELSRFRDHLHAAVSKDGEPESGAYGYRSRPTRKALEWWALREPRAERGDDPGIVGWYLFSALGPVPTDHYEKDLRVRQLVKQVVAVADEAAGSTMAERTKAES